MNGKLLVLAFIVFLQLQTINAQDTIDHQSVKDLLELSLDDFMDLVITPSKQPQSLLNVTQKVDVINASEIETKISGNRNICEVLSELPGGSVTVLSRNDANWGTYGGIGPKYSTYMLQGIPIDAFIDPMSLELNAIDHIEIQRGPASVIYPNYLSQDFAGNQSPLAGTVNLILKSKIEKPKTVLRTSFGSFNTINGQMYHQGRTNRLNYFFGSSYEMSDYTNYGSDESWLNMKKNPEYTKTKLYGGLTLFIDKEEKHKLTVFYQRTFHSGDVGRVYRGYDNDYSSLNAGYDVSLSDNLHLQSHFGIRKYDRSWQESEYGLIDTLISNNGVNQLILPADISLAWNHGKASTFSIGADYQGSVYTNWTDPLIAYNMLGTKASANQIGVYVQEEWRPIQGLTLRSGLRHAIINNQIALANGLQPENREVSWNKLLWSIGARYSINEMISVYSNGGSSFSTPGLKSTYGTILLSEFAVPGHHGQLPNNELKPESGLGLDAGIDLKIFQNIKFGSRLFYSILQDAIVDNVVSQSPSQTQSLNAGSSSSKGGEIELSQEISSSLSWFGNFTYILTNTKHDLNPDQNNVEIPFSPKEIVNVGINYSSPFGLTFTPSLNYKSGIYDGISKSDRKLYTQGLVVNAYISQLILTGDTFSFDCFCRLSNITNNQYEMPWQFRNPGFSGMFGIRMVFD